MKSIASLALESGMVLASDVYSYQNHLIAKEGEIVDTHLISKLSRYSIMCVDIKEPEDFTMTRHEQLSLSNAFKNFETVYKNHLDSYQFMMDSFLKGNTPMNLSYLLTIHDKIHSCCKDDEQLLSFLYHLNPEGNHRIHCQLLYAAMVSSVFGRWSGFTSNDLKLFILCGFFYDIGKLRLPVELLEKEEPFTAEEARIFRSHTQLGYDLIKNLNINEKIKQCTLHHHEKYDGSGYPAGLKGNAIDSFSRYISIVDAYVNMTFTKAGEENFHPANILTAFQREGFGKYDFAILKPILDRCTSLHT